MTLEELDKFFNNPTMKVIRELQDNPAFRLVEQVERSLPRALIQQFNDPVFRVIRQAGLNFKHLQQLENNPVFHSNRILFTQNESLQRAISIATKYSIVSYELDDNNETITERVDSSELDFAIEQSVERSENLPKGRLGLEFYLNHLITLMIVVYTTYSSSTFEQELLARIDTLETALTSVVTEIEESPIEHHFIVKKNLNLRAEPKEASNIIEVLPSKLKVSGLKTFGQWVNIEYFDYLSNQMVSGWVESSFLLPVIAAE
ncbi:SH3 domain-containing protein [Aliivibrio fischeri]|uniref:SH3 type 3 domain-containing protein n=1 Tax=Aliivibrio fischeri SR5 TaxID=1088719 RepID=A0AAV3EPC5_ALIFS|nr:SH3 domain-containing protein [Aliivibrio fischeri]EHN68695.1 SH3 type 3 domain-containing protein [Aliivibrio fischeri SR5]